MMMMISLFVVVTVVLLECVVVAVKDSMPLADDNCDGDDDRKKQMQTQKTDDCQGSSYSSDLPLPLLSPSP